MNHYERLKVARDAPPEVIRAAYRALATKLHPDRSGAPTGPDDELHTQMAALNAAYEVLIDPQLRQNYDATLLPPREMGVKPLAVAPDAPEEEPAAANGHTGRVEVDWLTPKTSEQPWWRAYPRLKMSVIGLSAVTALSLGVLGWYVVVDHRRDRVLSEEYVTLAVKQGREAEALVKAAERRRRPSVDDLARMTDEELLQALPPDGVVGEDGHIRVRSIQPHPLDGTPLNLRHDQVLVDPLAP